MKVQNSSVNTIPALTWRWLNVNEANVNGIDIADIPEYGKPYLNANVPGGVYMKGMNRGLEADDNIRYFVNKNEKFGVSDEYVQLAEQSYNSGIFIQVPSNFSAESPVMIRYQMDGDDPLVIDDNIIELHENSSLTVVFDYSSADDVDAFHNGVTKIYAMDGSVLNIIVVQRMKGESLNFNSIVSYQGRGAKVNYVQAEIGARKTYTNYQSNLNGENGYADVSSIYFGDKDNIIDMSYLINHIGRRTASNIETHGALKDRSRKVFRGTIDFRKGCGGAKGREEESAILLDKTVKASAVPILLATEEDVDGQHAASAGKIDEDRLFYLMSRGLSESGAKKLIVEASFTPVINRIPSEDLRNVIDDEIHRRIENE